MTFPNYRSAKCCQYCKHGHSDMRAGCNVGYWCDKHKDESTETGICDDYVEMGGGE